MNSLRKQFNEVFETTEFRLVSDRLPFFIWSFVGGANNEVIRFLGGDGDLFCKLGLHYSQWAFILYIVCSDHYK